LSVEIGEEVLGATARAAQSSKRRTVKPANFTKSGGRPHASTPEREQTASRSRRAARAVSFKTALTE
jgi:hypothetical protein